MRSGLLLGRRLDLQQQRFEQCERRVELLDDGAQLDRDELVLFIGQLDVYGDQRQRLHDELLGGGHDLHELGRFAVVDVDQHARFVVDLLFGLDLLGICQLVQAWR